MRRGGTLSAKSSSGLIAGRCTCRYWQAALLRGTVILAFLPDDLPGQVHSSGSSNTAAGEPFSLFSVPIAAQREQTASRQQQPAQQSRFYDGYASAEQQVLVLSAIPMWKVAMYGPQAQSCQCWTFAPGFNDTFHAGGLSVC